MPVVFVDKDIVYSGVSVRPSTFGRLRRARNSLRWFSRGASVGGAKVKLCICAVWGSNGRPDVSGMPSCCTTVLLASMVAIAGLEAVR